MKPVFSFSNLSKYTLNYASRIDIVFYYLIKMKTLGYLYELLYSTSFQSNSLLD